MRRGYGTRSDRSSLLPNRPVGSTQRDDARGRLRRGGQLHPKAPGLQAPHRMALQAVGVQVGTVIRPHIPRRHVVAQQVVDADQQTVGHRKHRPRLAPSARAAVLERLQLRAGRAGERAIVAAISHRMGLRWRLPLVAAPLSCLPALRRFPGQPPAHEAQWFALGNRALPVGADLGPARRGGDGASGRQREQQLDRFLLLGAQGGQAHLDALDRLLQLGEVGEQFTQHLPMRWLDAPGQRPASARRRAGRLSRNRPLAKSATTWGSDAPASMARCLAPAHTPASSRF